MNVPRLFFCIASSDQELPGLQGRGCSVSYPGLNLQVQERAGLVSRVLIEHLKNASFRPPGWSKSTAVLAVPPEILGSSPGSVAAGREKGG